MSEKQLIESLRLSLAAIEHWAVAGRDYADTPKERISMIEQLAANALAEIRRVTGEQS